MNRIDETFNKLKTENKKALIPYITAGFPNMEKSVEIFHTIEKNGGDIVEFGIPYSDPLADGPVVENAALKSIANGFKLYQIFDAVKNIRKTSQTPIVFMVYYNTIFGYGTDKFIEECVKADIDGLIIPDLPIEESSEIQEKLNKTNIYLIQLVALTSKDRVAKIVANAKGFIYCVSSLGVTGQRNQFDQRVFGYLEDIKKQSKIPTAVGFGITNKKDVENFSPYVDGVIVGSSLINTIENSDFNLDIIGEFIKELKEGCN